MIGRKTIVFLSMLGTLCLCALMAQSALAVPWETNLNTTAFECVSKAKGGFDDAHCNTVNAGGGSFAHAAIQNSAALTVINQTTKNKTTEATDMVLEAINKGKTVKVDVREVSGTGTINNVLTPEEQHTVEGSVLLEYRTFIVKEPAKCLVKEPGVEFTTKFKGVETPNEEMGLEFTTESGVLLTIELTGGECSLKGTKLEFKGSAVATGGAGAKANASGATEVFSAGNQSLSVGGEGASLTGTITTKESGGGPPIALTTVT